MPKRKLTETQIIIQTNVTSPHLIKIQHLNPFTRRVLTVCKNIPLHTVTTYKAISVALLGTTNGCRAVGNALRKNPYAPIVPCHRIIASDCTLGGFGGITDIQHNNMQQKIQMLQQEGIVIHNVNGKYTVDKQYVIAQDKLNGIVQALHETDYSDTALLQCTDNDYRVDIPNKQKQKPILSIQQYMFKSPVKNVKMTNTVIEIE